MVQVSTRPSGRNLGRLNLADHQMESGGPVALETEAVTRPPFSRIVEGSLPTRMNRNPH